MAYPMERSPVALRLLTDSPHSDTHQSLNDLITAADASALGTNPFLDALAAAAETMMKADGLLGYNTLVRDVVATPVVSIIPRFILSNGMRRMWQDWWGREVYNDDQEAATAFITTVDNPEESDTPSQRTRPSYSVTLATECKLAIPGVSKDTAANRLVAHKWLYDKMVENNVRSLHMAQIMPMAIELVFVKNAHELAATRFRHTNAALDRRHLEETTHISRESPHILNWFGWRRSAPPVPGS